MSITGAHQHLLDRRPIGRILEGKHIVRQIANLFGFNRKARDQRVVGVNGTPARSILESARSEDAHLIVMGTNQRKGWERLLIGSVTEDLIRDPHRDVLIIPIGQA